MATVKIRNISGGDFDVPTPDGRVLQVPANHQVEVDAEHAKGLLVQEANWEKVQPPKKDKDGD